MLAVLKIDNEENDSFMFLPSINGDKVTINYDAKYMLSPLKSSDHLISWTNFEKKDDLYFTSEQVKQKELSKDNSSQNIFLELHPMQARMMRGDSGGPLCVTSAGDSSIVGIVSCSSGIRMDDNSNGFYRHYYVPVNFHREWINDILSNHWPEGAIMHPTPCPHVGMVETFAIEFKLVSGTCFQIFEHFGCTYKHNNASDPRITYNKTTSLLEVDDMQFDFTQYNSEAEIEAAMMASGKFQFVKLVEDALCDTELLKENFIENFTSFLSKKPDYSEGDFNRALEKFYELYHEVKAIDSVSLDIKQEQKLCSWNREWLEENRSNQFAAEYNAAYPGAEENGNGPFAIIIYEEQTNITGDISETY